MADSLFDDRLRAWLDTWIGGARLHQTAEPVYSNPGELKADIRASLKEKERMAYFMREIANCAENYRNAPNADNGALLELAIKKARGE